MTHSPTSLLPIEDVEFLRRDELRSMRLAIEYERANLVLQDHKIASTIAVFGSARIPAPEDADALVKAVEASGTPRQVEVAKNLAALSPYYQMARDFARIVSERGGATRTYGPKQNVVITGGGPGIMEAANRGAMDAGAPSIGLNIYLPMEQMPNRFITPSLNFSFRYFAIRKFHLVMRTNALAVFPGGAGTLDELFEIFTLRQTGRAQSKAIILFGRDYWNKVFDLQFLADQGVMSDEDLDLISYADSAEEGWKVLVENGLPIAE